MLVTSGNYLSPPPIISERANKQADGNTRTQGGASEWRRLEGDATRHHAGHTKLAHTQRALDALDLSSQELDSN